jgi:hypothetical protein
LIFKDTCELTPCHYSHVKVMPLYLHVISAHRFHDVVIQIGVESSSLLTVARHSSSIGSQCTFSFENPVRGRYVKIMLEAIESLNTAELEVFAK